jgi:2-succinyl-5-enolpyruvyl-6-hydroxy-3-cyclohexene-1-carboxylate synthase
MGKYTNEKNAQVVLALLKAHGVRRIVVSPGSTNIPISGSIQNDPYFEVYSSVDERSAAYIACGLAEKTGEAVALSCTGATASRNYLPGMTEAYYRKLPVIAITSFTGNDKVGHLVPQIIDRNVLPNDAVKLSVQLPFIKDAQDEWQCNTLVNTALNAAFRDGGGPVHINLPSSYTGVFDADTLPTQRVVEELNRMHDWPEIRGRKVALFIGSHRSFTSREVESIEEFCASRDAIVACDHTSSYRGGYRVQPALIASNFRAPTQRWQSLIPDLVIHIGEVSGDYYGSRLLQEAPEVWRVSSDGALRDTGKKLRFMFQGDLVQFLDRFEPGGTENRFFRRMAGERRSAAPVDPGIAVLEHLAGGPDRAATLRRNQRLSWYPQFSAQLEFLSGPTRRVHKLQCWRFRDRRLFVDNTWRCPRKSQSAEHCSAWRSGVFL